MYNAEFHKPNILLPDKRGQRPHMAGDLSSPTEDELVLLTGAVMEGRVRVEGPWYVYYMGNTIAERTISRRVVIDALKRGDV